MRIRRISIAITFSGLSLLALVGCRSTSPAGSDVTAPALDASAVVDQARVEPTGKESSEDTKSPEGAASDAESASATPDESSENADATESRAASGESPAGTKTPNESATNTKTPNESASNTEPRNESPATTETRNESPSDTETRNESPSDTETPNDSPAATETPNTESRDDAFTFESASSVALARPVDPQLQAEPTFSFEIGSAESPIVEELRSDPLYYTNVRDVDCPQDIAADSILCQEVTLPESYDNPANGRTVKLMVATVNNGDPLGIGPVVYLQGGPGVGVVDNARTYVGGNFDIILVDQRGTGLSEPSLDCTEQVQIYPTLMSLESRSGRAARVDAGAERRCVDRLASANVNLSSFTSENNADDIALLRRVLGYEQWNLFGSSYGTRLALTVLRDHPEGVRSVVLDAVLTPEADFFGSLGANYVRALDQLNQACRDDVVCAQNYGDLREAVDVASALLDYSPVTVRVERPVSGEAIDVLVDGPRFHGFIFDRLYSTSALPGLPAQIHAATTGEVSELAWRSVTGSDPEGFAFSEAMYWSVMCAEEVPFIDDNADARLAARADDSIVDAFATSAFDETCSRFAMETKPNRESEPVTTDVPILAATGSFDPVTPPAWGQAIGDRLPNATFVEFSAHAHGTASPCFMTMTNAFFSDPTAPVDTTCANEAAIPFE